MNTDAISIIVSYGNIITDKKIAFIVCDLFKLTRNEKKKVFKYWLSQTKVIRKEFSDCVRWFTNGKLHRENDLPAIEWKDGRKEWFNNKLRHRDGDLPAFVGIDGRKEWWMHGKLYRDSNKHIVELPDGLEIV